MAKASAWFFETVHDECRKFDPGFGLCLPKRTVSLMIAWFFICLSGVLGHIANYTHGFGLVLGMAWGYLVPKTVRQGL